MNSPAGAQHAVHDGLLLQCNVIFRPARSPHEQTSSQIFRSDPGGQNDRSPAAELLLPAASRRRAPAPAGGGPWSQRACDHSVGPLAAGLGPSLPQPLTPAASYRPCLALPAHACLFVLIWSRSCRTFTYTTVALDLCAAAARAAGSAPLHPSLTNHRHGGRRPRGPAPGAGEDWTAASTGRLRCASRGAAGGVAGAAEGVRPEACSRGGEGRAHPAACSARLFLHRQRPPVPVDIS